MECKCGKLAARDCDYSKCAHCCPGCPRHPSEQECQVCEYLLHECDCSDCGNIECHKKVPHYNEYNCNLCGPMCEECFGNEFMSWSGETYCEICGNGMYNGGIDNSSDEGW